MVDDIIFEVCAQTENGCRAADAGGAHRIELCSALEVGGLTPELALVAAVVEQSRIPVHVLLRPAADQFRFSWGVMDELAHSVRAVQRLGVAGIVLGLLQADDRVDVEHTRDLVRLAAPLPVTFHRAFDVTPDLAEALEDVIATGCSRVLTSGGAPDVLAGTPALAGLIAQAGDRIEVAVGGGLRFGNAERVARTTHGRHFHASLRYGRTDGDKDADPSPECVQAMVDLLMAARKSDAARLPATSERAFRQEEA